MGSTLICAPVMGTTIDEMLILMNKAKECGADLVEVRLDYLASFDPLEDVNFLIKRCPLPTLFTYRPKWEGGQYEGDEKKRLDVLRLAMEQGADYVDIELQRAEEFNRSIIGKKPENFKVIVSNHNYQYTPDIEDLGNLVAKIQSTGADVVKIATTATDVTDVERMFHITVNSQVPVIGLVMGEKGLISRILCPKFGGYLTFGVMEKGKVSAPGQPTIEELLDLYNFRQIGPDTKVFGVIGRPVGHSKSPLLYNTAFKSVGFNGVYVPFLVDNVQNFLLTYSSTDFSGFSCTIPHKEAALECCDEVDQVAKSIGAVNCIVKRADDGKLLGYNTDYTGAVTAIENGLREKLLMTKRPHLYWTPCAAHCLDLILEDIGKNIPKVKIALKKSMGINAYIHSSVALINMMRRFTGQRNLHRSAVTRFATSFITLASIHKQKNNLRKMVTSQEWTDSKWSKDSGGKRMASYLMQESYWKNVLYAFKLTGPIVKVLRMVDGDKKPPMGYIYEAMDRAKEAIANSFGHKEEHYEMAFKYIDTRWECQLHQPLHVAGHFLNPELYYSNPSIEDCSEVMTGLYDCISRLVPELATQDKILEELSLYKGAEGLFGKSMAVRQRNTVAPGAFINDRTAGSPLAGKLFVVIGAGGAGKSLAYGAKEKGARVVIANRTYERARALANIVGGDAISLAELESFHPEEGMILANTTSIGMQPNVDETPIPKHALKHYSLVFDAVYTPKITRLLREAEQSGATIVTGVEMFIGQANEQYERFTGLPAPKELFRKILADH